MNRIKNLCSAYGGWMLLSLPIAVIVLCVAVSAAKPQPRTIAESPAETEITFDMDRNRAYTAEDGIIVIGEMVTPTAAKTDGAPPAANLETVQKSAPAPALNYVKVGGNYTLPEDAQMADGSIVPPDTTIYDCMYGADKNGVTIVIQYKDKNGNWIDVTTQKNKDYLPGTFTEKLSDETLAEYATEVFRLVNEEREKAGLDPLERDADLDRAAIARADECVSVNSIYVDDKAHTRPNGSGWETVLDDMGIDWSSTGENSSSGRTSASDVMNAWLNSDGHRANILTQKRTQIGIGVRQASDGTLYWIQIFIRP